MTQASTIQAPLEESQGDRGGHVLIAMIRFAVAMGMAAAIFWYVGWWAVAPIDPVGAVSLLMAKQGVVSMAELLALCVVTSGLAVAICGEGNAERGPLAVAVGLAALGARGGQMDGLMLYRLNPPLTIGAPPDPYPAVSFVAETWLWLAMIGVGVVVGRWVASWFDQGAPASTASSDHTPDMREGLGTLLVVGAVTWLVINHAIGNSEGALLKGQLYFAVTAGVLVGGILADALFRPATPLWALLAVGVVASVAYIFFGPDPAQLIAARKYGSWLNLRPLVRPLPLEYAALGAAGALLGDDAMRLLRSLVALPERP